MASETAPPDAPSPARLRRRRGWLAAALALAVILAGGAAALLHWQPWAGRGPPPSAPAAPQAQTSEHAPAPPEAAPAHISTIIDLPGDPVFVRRPEDAARPLPAHLSLPAKLDGAAPKAQGDAFFVSTPLVPPDGGFMRKFPEAGSGSADEAAAILMAQSPNAVPYGDETLIPITGTGFDDDGGEEAPATFGAVPANPGDSDQLDVTIGGERGEAAMKEAVIRPVVTDTIGHVLAGAGFTPESAQAVEDAVKEAFNIQSLSPGTLAVARGALDPAGAYRVTQFALYQGTEYVGSVALAESGGYQEAAEPFLPPEVADGGAAQVAMPLQYNLTDGLYSAGIRNSVPEPLIREAILLVSKLTDMKQPLKSGETLRLLYSREPRDKDKGAGRIAFVGLSLPTGAIDCYVFQGPDGAFRCVDPQGQATGGGGFFAPVKGARLSSTFGFRMHPILHILRLHAGVDWAVGVGTPVMAVADGTVNFAGVQRGFGNHVRIQHKGYETSYSHLDHFAPGIAVGSVVTQGQLIAYSGNSGLSTGPHLHFQYYIGGTPVDPLLHMETQTASLDTGETGAFQTEKKVIDDAMAAAAPPAAAN